MVELFQLRNWLVNIGMIDNFSIKGISERIVEDRGIAEIPETGQKVIQI